MNYLFWIVIIEDRHGPAVGVIPVFMPIYSFDFV